MSYIHFLFHSLTFPRVVILIALLAAIPFSTGAQCAEWRECEQAKLRELKLQQGSGATERSKSKKRNQQSRSERIEEIDTWLWKNCREFSYELRQLEQSRM